MSDYAQSQSDAVAATTDFSFRTFLINMFIGLVCATILFGAWWLLALLERLPMPSLTIISGMFAPLLHDVSAFAAFNIQHNLAYILLLGGVLLWFELAFRARISEGRSVASLVGQFKGLLLLLGILSLAVSLPGLLEAAVVRGNDGKAAIGQIYFKFGLWVLGAVIVVVRDVVHQPAPDRENIR